MRRRGQGGAQQPGLMHSNAHVRMHQAGHAAPRARRRTLHNGNGRRFQIPLKGVRTRPQPARARIPLTVTRRSEEGRAGHGCQRRRPALSRHTTTPFHTPGKREKQGTTARIGACACVAPSRAPFAPSPFPDDQQCSRITQKHGALAPLDDTPFLSDRMPAVWLWGRSRSLSFSFSSPPRRSPVCVCMCVQGQACGGAGGAP